jgi:enamine deaminase RidA (YjgF/YER057c/UK114 family)
MRVFRAAFPDLHFTVEDMLADGDRIATRWTFRGTQQGVERIESGTIVEHWRISDDLGLLQQLARCREPSEEISMPHDYLNPSGVSKPANYTHVVSGRGRVVYLSGQVPLDADGNLVGEGDFAAQAEQVFKNLSTCLASVGAGFKDVVKLTTYIVNYSQELRPLLQAARARHLPVEHPPASTLVGVQALAVPGFMIEIEAVAIIE